MEKTWHIERYTSPMQQSWDDFVMRSRQPVFLFCREYMEYHSDRFPDYSLLCYYGDKLTAVLPAHLSEEVFASHNGLTFGGFISGTDLTAQAMLELFVAVKAYLQKHTRARSWFYRPIPYIYTRYPAEEDLYALFRMGAVLRQRKISSVIQQADALPFSTLRKRKVKKANKEYYTVVQDDGWSAFWDVLQENLRERHQAAPVHTLDEILLLHSRFPEHIILYRVLDTDGNTVAGTVLYVSECALHVQYIASTEAGRLNGAVDMLFDKLIHEDYAHKKYFDMGTSVEQGGWLLNEGLIFQKEGMGGRAVVYDMYELDLDHSTHLNY